LVWPLKRRVKSVSDINAPAGLLSGASVSVCGNIQFVILIITNLKARTNLIMVQGAVKSSDVKQLQTWTA
jgi:hypothetical protein